MSLLGIDIGTSGCKSVAFSVQGKELAKVSREYDILNEGDGYAELNCLNVWGKVKETIKVVSSQVKEDPIEALSVSSLGEAMVPVTKDRIILGNSILGFDQRGDEFLKRFLESISPEEIFKINGNFPGAFYSMPKIAWIKKNKPELYSKADYFLSWADFVCFMLGGRPITNYSLAGRTLLFDINTCQWSEKLLQMAGLDAVKFASPNPSGISLGKVSPEISKELNLNPDIQIISGGHDQCCAALGSGIINDSKTAMYGMGTYICVVPAYSKIPDLEFMFKNKLNIENHVVSNLFISLIYNLSGGALVKWFSKTFSDFNNTLSNQSQNIFDKLFDEIPNSINDIIVIPRFGPTGPPEFLMESAGTISGLSFNHTRGDILLALLEGITFYFKDFLMNLKEFDLEVNMLNANGGGSNSKKWLQVTADILNKPIARNSVTEASSLGASILAGIGSGIFSSYEEGVNSMIKQDLVINPILSNSKIYDTKFEKYNKLYSFLRH